MAFKIYNGDTLDNLEERLQKSQNAKQINLETFKKFIPNYKPKIIGWARLKEYLKHCSIHGLIILEITIRKDGFILRYKDQRGVLGKLESNIIHLT